MPEQRPETQEVPRSDPGLVALADVEKRVLSMVAALGEARTAQAAAVAEARLLREQVHERDEQVALLRNQLEGGGLRTKVRARLESLLQRVTELERKGRSQ